MSLPSEIFIGSRATQRSVGKPCVRRIGTRRSGREDAWSWRRDGGETGASRNCVDSQRLAA
jgi:hypothetical protein